MKSRKWSSVTNCCIHSSQHGVIFRQRNRQYATFNRYSLVNFGELL